MSINKKAIIVGVVLFSLIKIVQWIVGAQYIEEFTSAHAIAIGKTIAIIALGMFIMLHIIHEKEKFFELGCFYLLVMPLYFSFTTAYKYFYLGYDFRADHLIFSYISYGSLLVGFVALLLVRKEFREKDKNNNM